VIFLVEEAPEADDIAGLHVTVRNAVRCHFDEVPRIIRLPFVREEVITA